MLRLPDGMRDRIKAAAEMNNRSMNAEIVAALERAFPVPESLGHAIAQLHALTMFQANASSEAEREAFDIALKEAFDEVAKLMEGR